MTKSECAILLAILQSAYPRHELTQETIDVYTAMLRDLDYRAASAAVRRLIATSRYMPTIAEIRRAAVELVDPVPSTEDAWVEVLEQVRSYNPYSGKRVEWSHPAIGKAVAAVGWEHLLHTDNISVLAGQFRRAYESIRDSHVTVRQIAVLGAPVIHEALPAGVAE